MMILLMLVVVFFLTLRVSSHAMKAESVRSQDGHIVETIEAKQCPPHKWNYVEVKDTEGKTLKWKIVCEVCGPLQANVRSGDGDY